MTESPSKVVRLYPSQESDELVNTARETLTDAEAGEICGLAGITIYRDGTARFTVLGSAYANRALTLDLLERLRRKISDSLISE